MRVLALFAAALVAAAACSSEQVQSAPGCADACCSGNPTLVDCGENPNLTCVESGDPCTAQAYGCLNGAFFRQPQTSLPAGCPVEGGADATTGGEPDGTTEDGGLFSMNDDGPSSSGDGALDAPAEGAPDASADGALDGSADGALDASTDGALDASADSAPGDGAPDAP